MRKSSNEKFSIVHLKVASLEVKKEIAIFVGGVLKFHCGKKVFMIIRRFFVMDCYLRGSSSEERNILACHYFRIRMRQKIIY